MDEVELEVVEMHRRVVRRDHRRELGRRRRAPRADEPPGRRCIGLLETRGKLLVPGQLRGGDRRHEGARRRVGVVGRLCAAADGRRGRVARARVLGGEPDAPDDEEDSHDGGQAEHHQFGAGV